MINKQENAEKESGTATGSGDRSLIEDSGIGALGIPDGQISYCMKSFCDPALYQQGGESHGQKLV